MTFYVGNWYDDHCIVGIPPDQNSSNMQNYTPFLKSCILVLKIEYDVVLRLTWYPFVASQIETCMSKGLFCEMCILILIGYSQISQILYL